MMELAHWMARYYACPLGVVLAAMVPAAVKREVGLTTRSYVRLTATASAPQDSGAATPRISPAGRKIMAELQRRAELRL